MPHGPPEPLLLAWLLALLQTSDDSIPHGTSRSLEGWLCLGLPRKPPDPR